MRKLIAAALLAILPALASAGPVNVNTADEKTLDKELTGVGPKTAAAIVKERANGPFKDAADLKKRVKGVGNKTIESNAANLKFGG